MDYQQSASEIIRTVEEVCSIEISIDPSKITLYDVSYYRNRTEDTYIACFMRNGGWECRCEAISQD